MNELILNIFGGFTFGYWLSALFFGIDGYLLHKFFTFSMDGKDKASTPDNFSIKYWISDLRNWMDAIGSLLMFYTWVRFKTELVDIFATDEVVQIFNKWTNNFIAHVIFGLFFTILVARLRKYFSEKK